VAHSDATGKQARAICDGNKGSDSILWEPCHQRIQGKVGGHESSVFLRSLFLGRDKTHVEWVKAFTAIFDEMKKYVMEHHTTGLVWNTKAREIYISPRHAGVLIGSIVGHTYLPVQGRRTTRRSQWWCTASPASPTSSRATAAADSTCPCWWWWWCFSSVRGA